MTRVAAVARQAIAVVAVVMGALTQGLASIKLPPLGSAILGFAGAGLLVAEHIVSALPPSTSPSPTSSLPPPPPVGTK